MFTLELDLVITYTPPMSEYGGGIHLTRVFHLPFAPFNGLQICGQQIDHAPDPEGFTLKEVVWDIDREVFLGHVELVSHDLPMAEIPSDLRSWTELGWCLGSYRDKYETPDDDEDEDSAPTLGTEDGTQDDWEAMLQQPALSPRQRPKELNTVMRAMVRVMAEEYNDLPVAYAMDKTKRFFSKKQLAENNTKAVQQWHDAVREYVEMDWEQQWPWREKVTQTHPRLDRLVKQV